ncbi:MAG: ImmA/IrrE family metallo-endopeptidase, partial [Ktedonobacteraceae bacterium]
ANVEQGELLRLCSEAGVAVVFVQVLPGVSTCGATRWLTPTKALVQLSLRYKTDDRFWFTFFHEAAHILLHGKRQVFLDFDREQENEEESEKQANAFAIDMLVTSPGSVSL